MRSLSMVQTIVAITIALALFSMLLLPMIESAIPMLDSNMATLIQVIPVLMLVAILAISTELFFRRN